MPAPSHQFHRHPATPWTELRISHQSCYSYRLHAHAQYSIGIVDEGETLFLHDQGPEALKAGKGIPSFLPKPTTMRQFSCVRANAL